MSLPSSLSIAMIQVRRGRRIAAILSSQVRRKTSTMVFVRKEKNTEKQAKISDWK
jgi:hypothetical protein